MSYGKCIYFVYIYKSITQCGDNKYTFMEHEWELNGNQNVHGDWDMNGEIFHGKPWEFLHRGFSFYFSMGLSNPIFDVCECSGDEIGLNI